jgi:hypothetical protein
MTNNHLVTKKYVDDNILTQTKEPSITTLTSNSLLTNNQLVSKTYADFRTINPTNEPLVVTRLNINDMTNNHLVTKKYVDDRFTTEEQNSQLYPTSFFFGKQYDDNNSIFTRQIESGMSYIRFKNLNSRIYNVVFDCYWYINRSPPNNSQSTWFGNSKSSVYLSARYSVNFFQDGLGNWTSASAELISGNNLHQNYGFEGITVEGYIKFGLQNGKPSCHINFPNAYDNQTSNEGWVSGYGGAVKIVTSQPNQNNQIVLESSNDSGLAYFHKLWYPY